MDKHHQNMHYKYYLSCVGSDTLNNLSKLLIQLCNKRVRQQSHNDRDRVYLTVKAIPRLSGIRGMEIDDDDDEVIYFVNDLMYNIDNDMVSFVLQSLKCYLAVSETPRYNIFLKSSNVQLIQNFIQIEEANAIEFEYVDHQTKRKRKCVYQFSEKRARLVDNSELHHNDIMMMVGSVAQSEDLGDQDQEQGLGRLTSSIPISSDHYSESSSVSVPDVRNAHGLAVPAVPDVRNAPVPDVPAVPAVHDAPVPDVRDAHDAPGPAVPAVPDVRDAPVPTVPAVHDAPVPDVRDAHDAPGPDVHDVHDVPSALVHDDPVLSVPDARSASIELLSDNSEGTAILTTPVMVATNATPVATNATPVATNATTCRKIIRFTKPPNNEHNRSPNFSDETDDTDYSELDCDDSELDWDVSECSDDETSDCECVVSGDNCSDNAATLTTCIVNNRNSQDRNSQDAVKRTRRVISKYQIQNAQDNCLIRYHAHHDQIFIIPTSEDWTRNAYMIIHDNNRVTLLAGSWLSEVPTNNCINHKSKKYLDVLNNVENVRVHDNKYHVVNNIALKSITFALRLVRGENAQAYETRSKIYRLSDGRPRYKLSASESKLSAASLEQATDEQNSYVDVRCLYRSSLDCVDTNVQPAVSAQYLLCK